MILRTTLNFAAVVLLALIALNGFLAFQHLKAIQNSTILNRGNADIGENVAGIRQDLTDMETGQRGYLLTEDTAYLNPYNDGKRRISNRLANLRSELINRGAQERSLATQLEAVAALKQAEMEKTINLRQQGYRKRAFEMVGTNEGRKYMEQAGDFLSSLSAGEQADATRIERARSAALSNALSATIAANLGLLGLTALLFLAFRHSAKTTEREAAQSKSGLRERDAKLERISAVLVNEAPGRIALIEANARLLVEKYEGFLPRQGSEFAEQIRQAAVELESLRNDLLGQAPSLASQRAA